MLKVYGTTATTALAQSSFELQSDGQALGRPTPAA
jgi:hypothetical protein